jgi:hypothetical protein
MVAVHVRIDFPDKSKSFAWEQPNGTRGLSGTPVADLPLYGTELLSSLPDGSQVIVTEGEKAANALRNAGIPAVGTITGASGTPGTEALRPLVRLRPVLWPDNDDVGRNHMERIAARLAGLSTPTKLIKWVDVPEKGDAHDFLANGAGVEELNRLVATAQPFAVPGLASILDDIVAHNKQYLVISREVADAIALWDAHTHAFNAADTTPYLNVRSPVKRSGKSRVLEVQEFIVARPWLTAKATTAVLPRKIDAECPTLLLDEGDTAFKGEKEYSEALRGVLNSGWRRGGATSVCVGQGAKISYRDFSTFCPKMIACIGNLPDTVEDRSIPIDMRRRTRAESKEMQRFRLKRARVEGRILHDRLAQWAEVFTEELASAQPSIPDELDDRAADIWEPLLSIADLAGCDWPDRARKAAVLLSGTADREDDTLATQLLSDIKGVFKSHDASELPSNSLVFDLIPDESKPWGDTFGGKPLDARILARMLRPFGIKPVNLRFGTSVVKGYKMVDFLDAWERYVPSAPGNAATTATDATGDESPSCESAAGPATDPYVSATDRPPEHPVADRCPLQDHSINLRAPSLSKDTCAIGQADCSGVADVAAHREDSDISGAPSSDPWDSFLEEAEDGVG